MSDIFNLVLFNGMPISGGTPGYVLYDNNGVLGFEAGGGGGSGIVPESGSGPIKISAFPGASLPMGGTDTVTGLQGGANVNFSQEQILTGQDATAGSGAASLFISSGNGYGSGGFDQGGRLQFVAGHGGTQGNGGILVMSGGYGYGTGNGGYGFFVGGLAYGTGNGGNMTITGGLSQYASGGNAIVRGGRGNGTGKFGGNVLLYGGSAGGGALPGNILLTTLPSTDPATTYAIWNNNGVVALSGITNFSGTITTASLVGKTITVVNGVITSFV